MSTIRLSPKQQQVVDHGEGPLIVVAGPGSGKTRVLTERVRRLLTTVPGHFRVLALTFTNKAANEMSERLVDLGEVSRRATISTIHGFCLEMLRDRGTPIGIIGEPHIFEQTKDRKQILLESALYDPLLAQELSSADQRGERAKLLDRWLGGIATIKTHPFSRLGQDDDLTQRVIEAYDAGLRACGAYDFEDLLVLAYRLLTEFPKVADLYRRIYGYICIDEAQDLNEAQYAVLTALCGDTFRNVMMVGDPKQSIYGFNNASPEYMKQFYEEFNATLVQLDENFRSSEAVVNAAKALDSSYSIVGQLPIKGEVKLGVGNDEEREAIIVCDKLQQLFKDGHPDVENGVTPQKCAILGRTRYALPHVEQELKNRNIPFYKRLSSAAEYESAVVQEFMLSLRVYANPRDRLHMLELTKCWEVNPTGMPTRNDPQDVIALLGQHAATHQHPRHRAIVDALRAIQNQGQEINLTQCIPILQRYADALGAEHQEERRAIYDDTKVLLQEWDQYLRSGAGSTKPIAGFMSSMALGTTRQARYDGVALLTVHSSKGLEFDVVFIVGMADGVFPDYRAKDQKAKLEEDRNAFVAVTRSKRLLYLSYPSTRKMPWVDIWNTQPSPYLRLMRLVS